MRTGSERFVLCEQSANNLLGTLGNSGCPPTFARDVLKRQEKLRSVWNLLLDYLESRATKMGAAENLHKFNRDIHEMHERLGEKRAAMSADYGRDTKQVYQLILQHEVFENELAQLHEQLKVGDHKSGIVYQLFKALMEEGGKLKDQYPGPNADHIGQQLASLAQSWHDLKDAALSRRNKLVAAYDFQKFLSKV